MIYDIKKTDFDQVVSGEFRVVATSNKVVVPPALFGSGFPRYMVACFNP